MPPAAMDNVNPQFPQSQQRQRSKSNFSFKSSKSQEARPNSANKQHQRGTSRDEKPHFTASTKADPNAAMNEVQPIAAALEKPTLQSLRSFQHTDANGNPIAEPDLSNPTRSRWERPLDTIRSFEAAIDNEYRRRAHTVRGGEAPSEVMSGYASRRSSYYANNNNGYGDRSSYASGGYYGARQSTAGRDSWADYNSNYGGAPPNGPRNNRYNPNRMQSDPGWNRYNGGQGNNPYPPSAHGYQPSPSRDTVMTGGSNGSQSDPYSGEQSNSENSSFERGGPVRQPQPDMGEQYGFTGFGANPQPILEEYGNTANASSQQAGNSYFPPQNSNVPPPKHNQNPIRLNQGEKPKVLTRKAEDMSEKRGSWFKRRFSKNA